MFDAIFAQVLRVALVLGAFQLLLFVIGTNLYEIRQIKQQRAWRQHPFARRLRRRPLVTLLLLAGKHDADNILPSLLSAAKSSYKKVEVIVIDKTHQRVAKQLADEFSRSFPSLPVRVVNKKADDRPSADIHDAMRRHGRGELAAVLPAGYIFSATSLAVAVQYFNDDDSLNIIRPAVSVNTVFSSLGVLRKYQLLLSLNMQKGRQLFAGAVVPGESMICRRQVLTSKSKIRPDSKVYFADDVSMYQTTTPFIWSPLTQTFIASLRGNSQWLVQWQARLRGQSIWRLVAETIGIVAGLSGGIALLLIPLLTGYFIYLAVVLGESLYLLSGIALVTVFLLFAIWEDRQLRRPQKLAYSLGVPLAFSYLLGVSIVIAAALITSLLTIHRHRRWA